MCSERAESEIYFRIETFLFKAKLFAEKKTDFYRFVSTLFYFNLLFLWAFVNFPFDSFEFLILRGKHFFGKKKKEKFLGS